KSIPVPAGPNVCSKKGEGDNPSRRDGMFMLTWHMRLTGHYIRYPDITLRPYGTRHLHAHGFYKHCVPTGRWSYDRASVIPRFHPQRCSTQIKNPKSTINNRKSIPVPAGPNVCSTIPGTWTPVPWGRNVYPDLAHEIDRTLQWVPRHNIASLRDAVPHRHVFYKHCVPTGRWAYDQASVILRSHPKRCSTQLKNPKSTINNRKSIPVPAGPNVCSKKGEGDNPSRR